MGLDSSGIDAGSCSAASSTLGRKDLKMRYTKKMHAKALLVLLNNEKPCSLCPGEIARSLFALDSETTDHCNVCTRFVSKRSEIYPECSYKWAAPTEKCPCYKFGKEEAIKRTWIALEASGYLDTDEEKEKI